MLTKDSKLTKMLTRESKPRGMLNIEMKPREMLTKERKPMRMLTKVERINHKKLLCRKSNLKSTLRDLIISLRSMLRKLNLIMKENLLIIKVKLNLIMKKNPPSIKVKREFFINLLKTATSTIIRDT